jgi:phosphotransferase system HPr-like phosphotransfer protein
MSLSVSKGVFISVGADGEDENTAVEELLELIKNNFNEDI